MPLLGKNLAIAGLLIGAAGLVLQFFVSIPAMIDSGLTLPLALIRFFSFFTILSNLLLVFIYLGAVVRGSGWLGFFRRALVRATAAASIALVMGFYHFILAGLWAPEGLFWVCDVTLHYVTPIFYLVWFIGWNRSGTIAWNALPAMLIYPLVYLVYAMVRGALIGEYPYPVLDAATLGYGAVAINILALMVLYLVLSLAAIGIDRSLFWPKKQKT